MKDAERQELTEQSDIYFKIGGYWDLEIAYLGGSRYAIEWVGGREVLEQHMAQSLIDWFLRTQDSRP